MIQTVENGTNRRFLLLVSFQQYVFTSVELKRLKRKILSFSKGGK